MEEAKIQGIDIDLIVLASMTPDMQSPSTACLVQQRIGAVRAACLGYQCGVFRIALCHGYREKIY